MHRQIGVILFFVGTVFGETRWAGPFADHKNGELVMDTPEVALAKKYHSEAYSQVRAILPELPIEEKFPTNQIPGVVPQQPVVYNPGHQHIIEPTTKSHFSQYAEEIPRSPFGEVPEVQAARLAHFKALMEAQARHLNVPIVKNIELSTIPPVQPAVYWVPVDTPEVAAAKREHAKAVAAAALLNN